MGAHMRAALNTLHCSSFDAHSIWHHMPHCVRNAWSGPMRWFRPWKQNRITFFFFSSFSASEQFHISWAKIKKKLTILQSVRRYNDVRLTMNCVFERKINKNRFRRNRCARVNAKKKKFMNMRTRTTTQPNTACDDEGWRQIGGEKKTAM